MEGIGIGYLYEDSGETIWTWTARGLYYLKKGADHFSPFVFTQESMDETQIRGMVEDNFKNLWLSTKSFFLKLGPDRKKVFIYGSKYGYAPNNPNGAMFRTTNGQILISNPQGYYVFSPEDLDIKTQALKIIITDFSINNLPVIRGKQSPLHGPVEDITDLRLQYDQNNFAFSFAAIDYREPESIRYFTKMEGYDNTWREALGDKVVNYFNVRQGAYVFRIKVMSGEGAEEEKIITIRVLPPWWETWWAFTIYGLLFLAAIFAIYRFQKQRIIRMERQKAQQVELVQAKEIEKAYHELRSTQTQLLHSEKMASLGELTAGIAHEIQNPLNFVNNFSEVNKELIQEMKEEIVKGNTKEAMLLAGNIMDNEDKIILHGQRADAIVKSMLQHSRSSTGQKEPVDINAMADEYLRLSYHGLRAKDKSFNAKLQTHFDTGINIINIIPQDIGRVLLNLYNNAFYAVMEKKNSGIEGYDPSVTVRTKKQGKNIEIMVKDNGPGIPDKIMDKIFQPFFTTKPTGQGTGLGLSLSYDIIKAHSGELIVKSVNEKSADNRSAEETGTEFIITLPV